MKYFITHIITKKELKTDENEDVVVSKVARIVGHANPMITMKTYEHLVVDDLKKAAARHPLVNPAFQPKTKRKRKEAVKEIVYIIEKPGERTFVPITMKNTDNFKLPQEDYLIKEKK